jgi:rubrerythrin
MGTSATSDSAALLAELNDLLQLDRDAVQAYTLAEKGLESEEYKAAIRRFRGDHERHIRELERLITARGGTPASLPHLSSSPFKLAAQGLGDLGSDTAVLLAFKSNERLSRDKYQRAANQAYPLDVQSVLEAGAEDESTHYDWVQTTLEDRGAGEATAAGKAERVFEAGHAKLADVMEAGEKSVMQGAGALRDRLSGAFETVSGKLGPVAEQLGAGGIRNVWIAVGVGFVASRLVGRSARQSHEARVARAARLRLAPTSAPLSTQSSPSSQSTQLSQSTQSTQSSRPSALIAERGVESRDMGLPTL